MAADGHHQSCYRSEGEQSSVIRSTAVGVRTGAARAIMSNQIEVLMRNRKNLEQPGPRPGPSYAFAGI